MTRYVFSPEFSKKIEAQLIRHEGLRLKPYRCSAGKLSIAVGRNLDDVGITKQEAMVMLRNDLVRVNMELRSAIKVFEGLSENRRLVLIDMCFNLGLHRFLKFKKMLAALEKREYDQAADEMLNSRWARQVGKRAKRLAQKMREG